MGGFKDFLESSTIHGLGYISTTKNLVKIFWIGVVISGFTVALFLISNSFSSWAESPISTSIESFPISEAPFPKVSVCPPEDTNTVLNYDLVRVENVTLNNSIRLELYRYTQELIKDNEFSSVEEEQKSFNEENKYRNWYRGFSELSIPYYGENNVHYFRTTFSASSGYFRYVYFIRFFSGALKLLCIELLKDCHV